MTTTDMIRARAKRKQKVNARAQSVNLKRQFGIWDILFILIISVLLCIAPFLFTGMYARGQTQARWAGYEHARAVCNEQWGESTFAALNCRVMVGEWRHEYGLEAINQCMDYTRIEAIKACVEG